MRILPLAALVATLSLAALPAATHAQTPDYELEGLVVTASPVPRSTEAMSTHVTILHGDELRARGLARVQDALREVAGLSVVQSGSFGGATSLFFRGGESDYVQVLVDGVKVNQPGGAFDFSGLTLDNVERIEVVRGPASALYGSDAVSGVIHIITRSGRGRPTGTATIRTGSYGTLNASIDLSGGSEPLGYGLSLSRRSTDGILAFNNDFTNTVLSGTVRLRVDPSTTARLAVRYADREFHFPTDGSGNVVDRNAFTFGDEMSVSMEVSRLLTERLELRALLAAHESDSGTDDQPDGPADDQGFFGFTSLDDLRRTEADVRANLHLGEGTVATLGVAAEEENQRSFNESRSSFGISNGRAEASRWNRAVYTHLVTEAGGAAFNAGARIEDNERFGDFLTWQLGAALGLGDGMRVRASLGRGIKEPTFSENYSTGFTVGNPDLEPEQSTSFEVGVDRFLLGDQIILRATYFDQSFTDLIQYAFTPVTAGGPNFYNVAEADARGLELSASLTRGGYGLTVGYTYLDTEVVDSGFDEGEGATFVEGSPLLRRPARTTSVTGTGGLGERVRWNASLLLVGDRDDRDFSAFPASPVVLRAYATLGLGVEAAVIASRNGRPGVDLLLRADNLLDEEYQEVFGFRAPGRGLYVGGKVRFGG
jgi:vitamin B12 transporter